ncbi:hypothetical protein [Pseudonocardia thermophila]|jgi:hypothetical protein|uniref:hypothetical protein n=1 Tax=Pseudonocardia thermophila TaxID=1848 RepID=UPI00116122B0|nr:hypothetical protein [Pseudonocardia thermophila]
MGDDGAAARLVRAAAGEASWNALVETFTGMRWGSRAASGSTRPTRSGRPGCSWWRTRPHRGSAAAARLARHHRAPRRECLRALRRAGRETPVEEDWAYDRAADLPSALMARQRDAAL